MRKILGIAVCALLFLSAVSTVGAAPRVLEDEEDLPQLVINTTDLFGGGDLIAIKMKDALFGVVYGNETNNNSIVIFAITKRYLGAAEVYDEEGNFKGKHPIPILTIFAQRLAFLLEFRAPRAEAEAVEIADFYSPLYHPIYGRPQPVKAVTLNRTWELERLTMDNESFIWNFTLRATNLSYDRVWPEHEYNEGDKLEKLEFTFHVNATVEEINITAPWYNVTVGYGRVLDSEFLRNESYNGTSITATFKYDHYVEGWDFSYNTSKLALETHLLLGCHISPAAASWIREQFIDRVGGRGFGRCMLRENAEGEVEEEINATTAFGFRDRPRIIPKGRDKIRFEDNWYRIGMFRWVSNITVWDNETSEPYEAPIFFQLHGGKPILPGDVRPGLKGIFFGFLAKGAFIYPQGYKLYHDPEFSASALFYDIIPVKAPSLFNLLPLEIIKAHLIETAVAILAVCALVAVLRRKRK
ncbi:MAG: hypothetical protein QME47_00845 [Candidatus Thermoplasmatota archaeon]|nr:hypothetical protein [Candidatus Thermoplasmatota archaeon]